MKTTNKSDKELQEAFKRDYESSSVQSRQHTFVKVLKSFDIDMNEARNNPEIVEMYKSFISGDNKDCMLNVINIYKPITEVEMIETGLYDHIGDDYSGFVVVG